MSLTVRLPNPASLCARATIALGGNDRPSMLTCQRLGVRRKPAGAPWFCRNKRFEDNAMMIAFQNQLIASALRKVLRRLHYPQEVILTCVRWYAA